MNAGRRGVLTAGTWCVDRNNMVDFWPSEDGLAQIDAVERRGGGSACNLACDMRLLDPAVPAATIALVGDDDDGRFLMAQADAFGIDRRRMQTASGMPTHYTDCFISRRSGRRTHIFFAGVANLLTPDHFDFTGATERFAHLGMPGIHRLLDGPWQGDTNGWVTVLKKARLAGLETNLELPSLEPERLRTIVRPCLPHLDYLIVNDGEIGGIAGMATVNGGVTDVPACIAAARFVLKAGAMRLVVAHFPMGAVAVARDGTVAHRPSIAVPQSEVVSANGAGDGFAAGMLYGLHEGWPLEDSLSLAHATAAAALRAPSTVDGVETWQANLALAERWGWRAA